MAKHNVYQFYAELNDYEPKVWRRFEINGEKTITELIYTVMIMFEMRASHLFELTVDPNDAIIDEISSKYDRALVQDILKDVPAIEKTTYQLNPNEEFDPFNPDPHSPRILTLNQTIYPVGTKFKLEYDFGDSWEVSFRLEKIQKEEVYLRNLPKVIDGQGFGIVENVGGVNGLSHVAELLQTGHGEEYDDLTNWLDTHTLDLNQFDLDDMNFRLKKLVRVYKELYEFDFIPTEKSMKILLRDYLNWGSNGY